jgi:nucleotide-binding universal stress UspA family protein
VSGPMLADVMDAQEGAAKRSLDEFQPAELKNLPVEKVLLTGDPAKEIVSYAAKIPGSLIVLPTHGYGPFRRFILGSVSAKVLHDTMSPVLTGVHLESAPVTARFGKVIAALDLEGGSEKTLRWAADIAKAFQSKLIVTHAAPSLEGRSGEVFDPNWRTFFANRPKKAIEDLLAPIGATADTVILYGDPSKQISELAQAEKADLIVIGRSHGAGRLRTHAYAIIRTSPCAVLSV